MKQPKIKNELLTANAGSGKTFALTTRIIRLLLAGVEPDRIAALTFTRKSAGEFLDNLLQRISKAAKEPEKLRELADTLEHPELCVADCRNLLAKIVQHFGTLGLSTIDSFFARMARHFPLETGLPEDFAIADSAALEAARERALASRFAKQSEEPLALKAMITQFRQITRRDGERNVFKSMLQQISELHNNYTETPPYIRWGDGSAIWGEAGLPFTNTIKMLPAIHGFREAIKKEQADLPTLAWEKLNSELNELERLENGAPWNATVKDFVNKRLLSVPKNGYLRILPKKIYWVKLSSEVLKARQILLKTILKIKFEELLERTKGLYEFMVDYETVYAKEVRGAGLVTFSDITELLARRASEASSEEDADLWRSRVAYRMDQKFDHWLLDEFQDTSRTQWKILKVFIEEVLMDDSGDRSFFYVGDTKQAIYSWRGGESDLFHEIKDSYKEAFGEEQALVTSWRSAKPIIDFVNTVFGQINNLSGILELPKAVVDKWEAGWNIHEIAEPNKKRIGYARSISIPKSDSSHPDPLFDQVHNILTEVDPISKGISCAILMLKNDDIAELAASLQSIGYPVAIEGKVNSCLDNPLGAAVLASLRAIAYPDDQLAAGIARGFPSAQNWGLDDLEHFREVTLQSIADHGYAATLKDLIEAVDGIEREPFLVDRGFSLIAAAADFDTNRNPSEGISAFLAQLEARQIQEAEASGVIRMMTVHQAKGLGFDMTIVAELDKRSQNRNADTLVLGPSKKAPEWGILLPPKEISETDLTLKALQDRETTDSIYNDLCTAYVALTRPKYALYVITEELTKTTTSKHFGRHLKETIGDDDVGLGNPKWFEFYEAENEEGAAVSTEPTPDFVVSKYRSPLPARPSQGSTRYSNSKSRSKAKEGTLVHEALAKIEWLSTDEALKFLDDDDFSGVKAQILTCLAKEEPKALFTKPNRNFELWRERAFEALIDGKWHSGVFDRVHLYYDATDSLSHAEIIDFKIDAVKSESDIMARVKHHEPQIKNYCAALRHLTHLPADKISASLLFTKNGRRVSVT
jgi:ATP-dependent helicase/nuclease subunit A